MITLLAEIDFISLNYFGQIPEPALVSCRSEFYFLSQMSYYANDNGQYKSTPHVDSILARPLETLSVEA